MTETVTVTLATYYKDGKKKQDTKTFRPITLAEVKAWAVPQVSKCYHDVPANRIQVVDGVKVPDCDCIEG